MDDEVDWGVEEPMDVWRQGGGAPRDVEEEDDDVLSLDGMDADEGEHCWLSNIIVIRDRSLATLINIEQPKSVPRANSTSGKPAPTGSSKPAPPSGPRQTSRRESGTAASSNPPTGPRRNPSGSSAQPAAERSTGMSDKNGAATETGKQVR